MTIEDLYKVWIFWVKWVIAFFIVLMLMVAVNFWRSIVVAAAIRQDFMLSVKNAGEIGAVKERQEIYRQQTLQYISDMIAAMNALQEDNKEKGIKVPKAPILRLPDGKLTESDLRRIPQPGLSGPTPTPVVKKEVIVKYKRIRVKPTPGPLERFFNPKSTR